MPHSKSASPRDEHNVGGCTPALARALYRDAGPLYVHLQPGQQYCHSPIRVSLYICPPAVQDILAGCVGKRSGDLDTSNSSSSRCTTAQQTQSTMQSQQDRVARDSQHVSEPAATESLRWYWYPNPKQLKQRELQSRSATAGFDTAENLSARARLVAIATCDRCSCLKHSTAAHRW